MSNGQVRNAAPRLDAPDPFFAFEEKVGQKLWSHENLHPFAAVGSFSLRTAQVLFNYWRPRGADSSLKSFVTRLPAK